jgi:hypothetical protein
MFVDAWKEQIEDESTSPQAQTYVRVWALFVCDIFQLTERYDQKHADRKSEKIILTRGCYYGFLCQSTVAFPATHNLTILFSSCNKRPEDTDISACKWLILHIEQGFTKFKYTAHFQGRKKELAGRL